MQIAVVGGTGREGRGLALRWARAGHQVAIGSRDADKAKAKAQELSAAGATNIEGGSNEWAVARSEVVVLSVPYGAHAETLASLKSVLAGKLLIDITVPIKPPHFMEVHLPAGQSSALEAQALLGAETQVVAALHHVSSAHLGNPDHPLECDVLVCSDIDAARAKAMALIGELGARALDAGPLRNAIALESLTPVILHLNKKYKTNAGIRFVGI